MVKFGIIGCGWIVQKVYLPLLNSLDNACIYAIFDTDEQKLTSIKEKFNIPVISKNLKDFLDVPTDAVIIASPNYTHSYYSNCSLESGKHVLCEKPVAFSKTDIEATITLAKKNNRIFFPSLVNRFRKDVQCLKEKSYEIGEITNIEVSWIRKSGIPKLGSWTTNKSYSGGGALIDIGTHIIDVGLMFVKKPKVESVETRFGTVNDIERHQANWNYNQTGTSLPVNVETWSCGKIDFKDIMINYNVSWCSDVDEDITYIKLYGEKGIIYMRTLFGFSKNSIQNMIKISIKKNNKSKETIFFSMENSFAFDAFKGLLNSFISSIEGRENPILKMSDAVYVVGIIEELYRRQGE